MNTKKVLTVLRWILGVAFVAISVAGSLSGKSMYSIDKGSLLNNPNGIIVDGQGRIYCGINYSRVNVYDNNGDFIRSISINSDGGDFKMELENDNLRVLTVRNRMLFEYDVNGKLIKKEPRKDSNTSFQQLSVNQFTDNKGNVYEIKTPLLMYPYIEKTTPTGKTTMLIYVPFSKWIFMSPYPSWHLGFIGLLLIAIDLKKLKKYLSSTCSKE